MKEYENRWLEYRCPVCGKNFLMITTREWAYKSYRKDGKCIYYCSWGCLRKGTPGKTKREKEYADKVRAELGGGR